MTDEDFDRRMMEIALAMARRGLGTAAPNPSVGAVIADPATGEIVARGWTQPGGRPHAEVEALRRAGDRARGATMYVTLEPCAHHGKTPPCTGAIVAAGLARVVVGVEDPDPRTAGHGMAELEKAGVEVARGVCAEEARWIALGHILRVTQRRPFVQAKLALDAAGNVPRGADGTPHWVTGPLARAAGHMLRAETDAVLVGSRTVIDDDPELTCRLPGLASQSPIRVVLSASLAVSLRAKLVTTAREHPLWIYAAPDADGDRRAVLEASGAQIVPVARGPDGVDPAAVLESLAGRGVTRLLVEGGPATWRAFAAAGLVDEAVLFQAGAAADTAQAQAALTKFLPGPPMTLAARRRIGDDRRYDFRRI